MSEKKCTCVYSNIAIIGRIPLDGEDTCQIYEHMTVDEAKQQFMDDMYYFRGLKHEDVPEDEAKIYYVHIITGKDLHWRAGE